MRAFIIGLFLLLSSYSALAETLGTMVNNVKVREIERQLELSKAQRNQFLDEFNKAVVKIDTLTEELNKTQARVKELEAKIEEKK